LTQNLFYTKGRGIVNEWSIGKVVLTELFD